MDRGCLNSATTWPEVCAWYIQRFPLLDVICSYENIGNRNLCDVESGGRVYPCRRRAYCPTWVWKMTTRGQLWKHTGSAIQVSPVEAQASHLLQNFRGPRELDNSLTPVSCRRCHDGLFKALCLLLYDITCQERKTTCQAYGVDIANSRKPTSRSAGSSRPQYFLRLSTVRTP